MAKELNSIQELIKNYLTQKPNRKIIFQKKSFRTFNTTAKDLYEKTAKTIYFLEKKGIKKSDSILIMGANSIEWVVLYFACTVAGIVVVPLDIQTDKSLIKKIQKQVKAKAIFVDRFLSKNSQFLLKKYFLDDLDSYLKKINETKIPEIEILPDDVQEIIYTSGSTGEPKGVVLTNRNVIAALNSATSSIRLNIKLKTLNLLPLSHSFSQMHGLFLLMNLNHQIYFIDTIQAKKLVNFIRLKKINALVLVPGILSALKKELQGKSLILELGIQLRLIGCGGATLDAELEKWWRRKLVLILQGYAMTETHSVCTLNELLKTKPGSVGTVARGVKVKIAKDKEILIKGKNVMRGYYKNPDVTKNAFTKKGFLKTGDLGIFKNNYLYIKGRKKDMILTSSGLNVYPLDIENILDKIRGVKESCVIQKSNKIHAVIIPDKNISDSELRSIIKKTNKKLLSHQKIQEYGLWHEASFPKTPLGKIKKYIVLEQLDKKRTKTKIYEKQLYKIIQEVLKPQKEITSDLKLSELGMDSLKRVELVTELENEYDTQINEENINDKTTVFELEKLIKETHMQKIKFSSWPLNAFVRAFRWFSLNFVGFPALNIATTTKYEGRENIQNLKEPVIYVSNHQSSLDAAVLLKAIKQKLAIAASSEIIFAIKIKKNLVIKLLQKIRGQLTKLFFNTYPFGENIGTNTSLELTGEMIDRDYSILIFPEGRRTQDGKIHDFRAGIGYLIGNMKIKIVPVKIEGLFEVLPQGKLWPKHKKTKVIFGKPLEIKNKSYIQATKIIEKAVKNL